MPKAHIPVVVGERFGKRVVLEELEPRGGYRRVLVRCDCGREDNVAFHYLTGGKSRSCRHCLPGWPGGTSRAEKAAQIAAREIAFMRGIVEPDETKVRPPQPPGRRNADGSLTVHIRDYVEWLRGTDTMGG